MVHHFRSNDFKEDDAIWKNGEDGGAGGGKNSLTWISCKDSRKGSSGFHIRLDIIILFTLEIRCKIINLFPGEFEMWYVHRTLSW